MLRDALRGCVFSERGAGPAPECPACRMAPLVACSRPILRPIRAAICAAHPSVPTLRRTMPPQIAHHGPSHPTMRPGRCRDEHGRAGLACQAQRWNAGGTHGRTADWIAHGRDGRLGAWALLRDALCRPRRRCHCHRPPRRRRRPQWRHRTRQTPAVARPAPERAARGRAGPARAGRLAGGGGPGPGERGWGGAALARGVRGGWLVGGLRPGVMERLGLGPAECQALNPRLVYGRITGWGQSGPLSSAAGHDINYIALSGALHAIGRPGAAPPPPLNYIGDYGGGAMLLAVGLLAALHEARQSGQGQVIDAAMTDGAALLSSLFYGLHAAGSWSGGRGGNLLDGGAHFYDSYICADGKFVAIGAIEPKFFRRLCALCGLDESFAAQQMERAQWPSMKLRLADVFRTRTRDEWCALLEGSDACFAPVLDWDEAPAHPHNRARGSFVTLGAVVQPAPAPRFSRTPAAQPRAGSSIDLAAALDGWGATLPAQKMS